MADIRVPTLGESVTEATVGKWFKRPGDAVAVDEPLVELETDKVGGNAARAAGVLDEIAVKNGGTVTSVRCWGRSRKARALRQSPAAGTAQKTAEQPKSAARPARRSSEMPMPPSVPRWPRKAASTPRKWPAAGYAGR